MTPKQRKFAKFLETIVFQRFNKKQLETLISKECGEKIKLHNVSKTDDELSDYNFLFGIDGEKLYGFFDIYFLKMRKKGLDDADFFVTEVAYQFD